MTSSIPSGRDAVARIRQLLNESFPESLDEVNVSQNSFLLEATPSQIDLDITTPNEYSIGEEKLFETTEIHPTVDHFKTSLEEVFHDLTQSYISEVGRNPCKDLSTFLPLIDLFYDRTRAKYLENRKIFRMEEFQKRIDAKIGGKVHVPIVNPDELEQLRLEKDIWLLIKYLTAWDLWNDIFLPQENAILTKALQQLPKHSSIPDFITTSLHSHELVKKNLMIKEWLEECAKDEVQPLELNANTTNIPWYETLLHISEGPTKTTKGLNRNNSTGKSAILSIHPDAQITQDCQVLPLVSQDQALQEELYYYLIQLLRAGEVTAAQQVAIELQWYWLSSSLRGMEYHHYEPLVSTVQGLTMMEIDEDTAVAGERKKTVEYQRVGNIQQSAFLLLCRNYAAQLYRQSKNWQTHSAISLETVPKVASIRSTPGIAPLPPLSHTALTTMSNHHKHPGSSPQTPTATNNKMGVYEMTLYAMLGNALPVLSTVTQYTALSKPLATPTTTLFTHWQDAVWMYWKTLHTRDILSIVKYYHFAQLQRSIYHPGSTLKTIEQETQLLHDYAQDVDHFPTVCIEDPKYYQHTLPTTMTSKERVSYESIFQVLGMPSCYPHTASREVFHTNAVLQHLQAALMDGLSGVAHFLTTHLFPAHHRTTHTTSKSVSKVSQWFVYTKERLLHQLTPACYHNLPLLRIFVHLYIWVTHTPPTTTPSTTTSTTDRMHIDFDEVTTNTKTSPGGWKSALQTVYFGSESHYTSMIIAYIYQSLLSTVSIVSNTMSTMSNPMSNTMSSTSTMSNTMSAGTTTHCTYHDIPLYLSFLSRTQRIEVFATVLYTIQYRHLLAQVPTYGTGIGTGRVVLEDSVYQELLRLGQWYCPDDMSDVLDTVLYMSEWIGQSGLSVEDVLGQLGIHPDVTPTTTTTNGNTGNTNGNTGIPDGTVVAGGNRTPKKSLPTVDIQQPHTAAHTAHTAVLPLSSTTTQEAMEMTGCLWFAYMPLPKYTTVAYLQHLLHTIHSSIVSPYVQGHARTSMDTPLTVARYYTSSPLIASQIQQMSNRLSDYLTKYVLQCPIMSDTQTSSQTSPETESYYTSTLCRYMSEMVSEHRTDSLYPWKKEYGRRRVFHVPTMSENRTNMSEDQTNVLDHETVSVQALVDLEATQCHVYHQQVVWYVQWHTMIQEWCNWYATSIQWSTEIIPVYMMQQPLDDNTAAGGSGGSLRMERNMIAGAFFGSKRSLQQQAQSVIASLYALLTYDTTLSTTSKRVCGGMSEGVEGYGDYVKEVEGYYGSAAHTAALQAIHLMRQLIASFPVVDTGNGNGIGNGNDIGNGTGIDTGSGIGNDIGGVTGIYGTTTGTTTSTAAGGGGLDGDGEYALLVQRITSLLTTYTSHSDSTTTTSDTTSHTTTSRKSIPSLDQSLLTLQDLLTVLQTTHSVWTLHTLPTTSSTSSSTNTTSSSPAAPSASMCAYVQQMKGVVNEQLARVYALCGAAVRYAAEYHTWIADQSAMVFTICDHILQVGLETGKLFEDAQEWSIAIEFYQHAFQLSDLLATEDYSLQLYEYLQPAHLERLIQKLNIASLKLLALDPSTLFPQPSSSSQQSQ